MAVHRRIYCLFSFIHEVSRRQERQILLAIISVVLNNAGLRRLRLHLLKNNRVRTLPVKVSQ